MEMEPNAIGFRVEPKAIHWVAVSGSVNKPNLIDKNTLTAPVTYEEPQRLTWYREQVQLLFTKFHPATVGIRESEPFAKKINRARIHMEGVVMEVGASHNLSVFSGAFKSIESALSSKRPKKYLDLDDFRGISTTDLSKHLQEALLVATASFSLVEDYGSTCKPQLHQDSKNRGWTGNELGGFSH